MVALIRLRGGSTHDRNKILESNLTPHCFEHFAFMVN